MIKAGDHDPDQIESQLHQSDVKTGFGNNLQPTNQFTAQTGGSDQTAQQGRRQRDAKKTMLGIKRVKR